MYLTGTVQSSSLDQQVELAEKAHQYNYEAKAMLAQVTWSTILSREESYKLRLVLNNAVIPRLQAWRAIADIEGKSEDEKEKNLALNHLKKIGNEITELCEKLLDSIYSLLRSERDPEAIVFYSTMGGDFCRYMREVASELKEASGNRALEFYIYGFDQAQYLEASHPLRLTLVLHLSDFYYEDVHLRAEVINMAQDAVSKASKLLEKAPNQESSVIVQQFKDRLSLWTPL
ncbi:unnamed protein product [Knipowitschia caucasica]